MNARSAITQILVVVAIAGAAVMATPVLQGWLRSDIDLVGIDAWGMFFSVLGVIYAITVGFILAELLLRFRTLATHSREELNAVEEIRDYLIYVDENEEGKEQIVAAVRAYLESVIQREWPLMMTGQVDDDTTDTSEEIYDLMRAVETLEMHDDSDIVALQQIIGHIGDITNYRTERLEMSRSTISPRLRTLIVFLSVVLGLGFMLMGIASALIQGFMVASVAVTLTGMWLVIADLNRPFTGIWRVSDAPFHRLLDGIDDDIARVKTPKR